MPIANQDGRVGDWCGFQVMRFFFKSLFVSFVCAKNKKNLPPKKNNKKIKAFLIKNNLGMNSTHVPRLLFFFFCSFLFNNRSPCIVWRCYSALFERKRTNKQQHQRKKRYKKKNPLTSCASGGKKKIPSLQSILERSFKI